MLYLSRIIKTNNNYYLYDAVKNKIIEIDEDIVKEIETNNLSHQYYDFINNNHLRDVLKPATFKVKYYYTADELYWFLQNRMKTLILALTEQCNLNCKYCAYMPKYINSLNGRYKLKSMTVETAIKAINIFMRASKNNPYISIGFYGGEPLLKFDVIKFCVNYCNEKYPFSKIHFDITTNGLLLEKDEIINFLIENDFSITLSLDGPKDIHDRFRRTADNKPSFEMVINNIDKLYRKSPRYFKEKVSFNAVVTSLSGNKHQFDFLDKLCKLEAVPVSVSKTDYFSEYLDKVKNLEENNSHNYQKLNNISEWMNYSFLRGGVLKEAIKYHLAYTTESSCLNVSPGGFCIPGSYRLFVTADGNFTICERVDDRNENFCLGNVDVGIDYKRLDRLLKITNKTITKCKSCWAAKLCSFCFKDIFFINDDFCRNKQEGIIYGMTNYLENFKDNKKITSMLENFA